MQKPAMVSGRLIRTECLVALGHIVSWDVVVSHAQPSTTTSMSNISSCLWGSKRDLYGGRCPAWMRQLLESHMKDDLEDLSSVLSPSKEGKNRVQHHSSLGEESVPALPDFARK